MHVVAAHLVGAIHEGAVDVPSCAAHASAALFAHIGDAEDVRVWGARVLREGIALYLAEPAAYLALPVPADDTLSLE
eukprot:CAMPEP_0177752638 /NCGR_PEP_ID=MMETSP0491_2-20121128/1025_1 /TAXON_ID=63592 /ORGANISM="Tetraselmis chuii, Strain PLY429" /LENGTH=76 /DNA_ID=CAMNT_0019267853 /DNA_START=485 /DNA_END=715 /DNA_ORIENTATION=-